MKTKPLFIKLLIIIPLMLICVNAYNKSDTYATDLQEGIAEKIVRFHVIANSDSEEDQSLKLKVRDGILDLLKTDMENIADDADSFDDAVHILEEKCPQIEDRAQSIIQENGYNYTVTATVCKSYFPAKTYCDIILPPGDYTALKVTIGNGDGHNWWCVMYPTLCFIDSSVAVLPESSKKQLSCILDEDEYDSILLDNDKSSDNVTVKYSCHLWEIISSLWK